MVRSGDTGQNKKKGHWPFVQGSNFQVGSITTKMGDQVCFPCLKISKLFTGSVFHIYIYPPPLLKYCHANSNGLSTFILLYFYIYTFIFTLLYLYLYIFLLIDDASSGMTWQPSSEITASLTTASAISHHGNGLNLDLSAPGHNKENEDDVEVMSSDSSSSSSSDSPWSQYCQ